MSSLHALATAREAAVAGVRARGMPGRPELPRYRVYCSDQAHSSIDKAVILLGLGHEALRKIPSDADFRMRTDALEQAMAEDRRAGHRPDGGRGDGRHDVHHQRGSGRGDRRDLRARRRRGCTWTAPTAARRPSSPSAGTILAGVERADSLVMNPHKWLFTPFDLSAFYCRRMDLLRQAFSLTPEYLRTTEAGAVKNLMDTGVQLGRRFRALKLWMILRYFGAEGIRDRLSEHMRSRGCSPAGWTPIPTSSGWRRCRSASSASGRGRAGRSGRRPELEALNQRLLDAMNATGEVFLSHTKLNGRFTLRLAVGNLRTEQRHVARAWELAKSLLERS